MTNNKEEILITKNDVFKFIDEKPPTLRNRAILKDMIEDVAKQEAIEFYKFANKQEMKIWILEEPNPTIEQLYSLWEQTKK